MAVTAFGGCLAALQLRFRLRDTDWFGDFVHAVVEFMPVSDVQMHFLLQAVTLGIAGLALFFWRQPSMLWLYVAAHILWFSVVALAFGLQDDISLPDILSEVPLFIIFFESTCALVFAGLAFCQSLLRRKLAWILTTLLILLLTLLTEFCSIVELEAFAGAISAAISGA